MVLQVICLHVVREVRSETKSEKGASDKITRPGAFHFGLFLFCGHVVVAGWGCL